uniref:Haloacid dehalogenase-like hydrolase domain-containing protein 3 n=1 Tax=Craspedostauros australis TaxID=1486917 RepID=A0A7R9WVY3_9STRA|mmetsp:Transcript_22268/g.62090  ORF Transcript_22268/g.62090 Transcript_22268/m.62090 type:complete len:323 (+) Transcript_22268:300-1268(+)
MASLRALLRRSAMDACVGSKSRGLQASHARRSLHSQFFTQRCQQRSPVWQQSTAGMARWTKVRPKRIRVITMDVTGTIVSFRGSLQKHYLGAASKCGINVDIDEKTIQDAFKRAYNETSNLYPCFGGPTLSAKEWWKECVIKSFTYCGIRMTPIQEVQVFQRIYSTFGSNAAYSAFDDARPFLRWAQRNGIVCGVLSNADERYGDSILPMLGFTHDELQFQVFSKDVGFEKPSPQIFRAAMSQGESLFAAGAEPCLPSEVLHIGNDFRKDFEGARSMGIHSLLLDRYGEEDLADEWKRRGAPVLMDLMDVVEYLGRSGCKLG